MEYRILFQEWHFCRDTRLNDNCRGWKVRLADAHKFPQSAALSNDRLDLFEGYFLDLTERQLI